MYIEVVDAIHQVFDLILKRLKTCDLITIVCDKNMHEVIKCVNRIH